MRKGDKVTHPQHGLEIGVISSMWADGSFEVRFPDGEYGHDSSEYTLVEEARPAVLRTSRSPQKKFFVLPPEKQTRLVGILRSDPNFAMPISVPPAQEDDVKDEIVNAEDGLTVATSRKLATSYDVVFSANPEIENLLEGSGAYCRPFFSNQDLVLLHGARRDFYFMLLDQGFQPTHMG